MKFLSVTELVGHFHPLLVHLPIGILLIALLLQWMSGKDKFQNLRPAVSVSLLWGMITAGASCVTGYLLSLSDDYDKSTVNWHMWMAIGVLAVSFLLYIKELYNNFGVNKKLLAAGLLVLVAVTGHLGGSLTHGSDYLTGPFSQAFSGDSTSNMVIPPVANIQEAVAYNDVVKPILQTKCYACHGEKKQKGRLRMDDIKGLMKGGKEGKEIEPGDPLKSELIRRLLLPLNDEKHMPPKEKSQPTDKQVSLLQWWIADGADFTKKVKELNQPEKIKPILSALQQPAAAVKKPPEDIPVAPVEKADEQVLTQLRSHGVSIVPIAQNSNYLTANFVADSVVNKEDLELLQQLKKQLIWLKMDDTNVGDESLGDITALDALTRLTLSNSRITDKALPKLTALHQLRYLNLTGTNVTGAGLSQLASLKNLKLLYLYKTGTKSADYTGLKKIFPGVIIDTGGYQVQMLAADTTTVKAPK